MNSALLSNVANHPAHMLNQYAGSPARLNDESEQTVVAVCKVWLREGMRSRVLDLAEGLDRSHKDAIRKLLVCKAQSKGYCHA
jgi:hypothetical protein